MKKLFTPILFLIIPFFLLAQQFPQAFNYQAVVRDVDGSVQDSITANFAIEIIHSGPDTAVYSEDHLSINTGKLGIVNFKVGQGVNPTSDFSQINWSLGQYKIKVRLNGDEMGTSDIVAVPFALYAQNSGDDGDWYKNGDNVIYRTDVNVGIGTTNPLTELHIIDDTDITVENSGGILIGVLDGDNIAIDRNEIMARENGEPERLGLQAEGGEVRIHQNYTPGTQVTIKDDGKVGIGTNTPQAKLHVIGRTMTTCLEITGGCDIKEDINSIEELEPGDVVVIDENNPGNVRRTNEAYDRKVAGVISGANGVNSGISLSQEDLLEGEYPLTMIGRVYVKITGKVEIGDMLTTSTKPGYAMAVKDYSKSNGTVIGKAMTSNGEGKGMVLVLINLQ